MASRPNELACNKTFEFDALAEASNYRRALLREFEPCLRGTILEVGSGIGQFTDLLKSVSSGRELLALEPDPTLASEFSKRHPEVPLHCGTLDDFSLASECDAIVSVNVLEHVERDDEELGRITRLLAPRHGHLCLFVPARMEIFAPIDVDFGHHRRYDRRGLKNKLERRGFSVQRLRYFNSVGYFAWWFTFRLLRRRNFSRSSVRIYDRLIFPPVYWIESRLAPPVGQSLLCVARAGTS